MAIRTTAIPIATFGNAPILPHRHNSSGAGGLFGCAGTINQTLSIIGPPTHRRLQCAPPRNLDPCTLAATLCALRWASQYVAWRVAPCSPVAAKTVPATKHTDYLPAIASAEIQAKAPRCRISTMKPHAAAPRRQRREGETERDATMMCGAFTITGHA